METEKYVMDFEKVYLKGTLYMPVFSLVRSEFQGGKIKREIDDQRLQTFEPGQLFVSHLLVEIENTRFKWKVKRDGGFPIYYYLLPAFLTGKKAWYLRTKTMVALGHYITLEEITRYGDGTELLVKHCNVLWLESLGIKELEE